MRGQLLLIVDDVNCGFFGGGCASVDTDVISDQLDLIVRLLQDRPAHRHLHAISPDRGRTRLHRFWSADRGRPKRVWPLSCLDRASPNCKCAAQAVQPTPESLRLLPRGVNRTSVMA